MLDKKRTKSELIAEVESVIQNIEAHTLPGYTAAIEAQLFVKGYKFQSPWVQKRLSLYGANVRMSRGQFVEHIKKMLGVSMKWLQVVAELLEKGKGEELHLDGITYQVKSLIDIYDIAAFHNDYARKLLLLIHSYESEDVNSNLPGKAGFPFSRAEVSMMEQHFALFSRISNVLDKNANSDIRKIIASIPEVTVDLDASGAAVATYGALKLSPLTRGITDAYGIPNLFWHVGKWIASYQADRFKAAQAEAKMLELRILQMRRATEGEQNASLDKQIEYQANRLVDLNYKIKTWEEKYA